jgi:dCMP deaminase
MTDKRSNYISWDEYFMGIALLSAKRSQDHKILSVGYNGMPTGCNDDDFPWAREGDPLETKYPYVCHAELNAILNNVGFNLVGCSIYTPLFPCNECSKAIIQSGIRHVIFLSDKYAATDSVRASKRMMDHAGVHFRQLEPRLEELTISYREEDV